ncbi:HNH nuclease [Candidatus Pelagibacterales bacterium]
MPYKDKEKEKNFQKSYHKKYYIKNKEKLGLYKKEYRVKNQQKIKEYFKEYTKSYRIKNVDKIKDYERDYSLKNRNKINLVKKNYRLKNKDKLDQKRKEYNLKNKEKLINYGKEYRLKNIEKLINYRKEYYKNPINKVRIKKNQRTTKPIYVRKKRLTDPTFKLVSNIRARFKKFLNSQNIKKKNKTLELVGCSPKDLKIYIEKQFLTGMNWENYGLDIWHIDHIKPLSLAKTMDDIIRLKLMHYTNLQPLWAKDNIKKSNKYDEKI